MRTLGGNRQPFSASRRAKSASTASIASVLWAACALIWSLGGLALAPCQTARRQGLVQGCRGRIAMGVRQALVNCSIKCWFGVM